VDHEPLFWKLGLKLEGLSLDFPAGSILHSRSSGCSCFSLSVLSRDFLCQLFLSPYKSTCQHSYHSTDLLA
jgi:hypothetical protein